MEFRDVLPAPPDRLHNARIRASVRGHGICASCFNPVYGTVDYPTAEDCEGFFHGQFEQGDAICWWCLDRWCNDVPQQAAFEGHG
jgi:hypothetical protein